MNARIDQPEYFGAPASYTLQDTMRIRREAERKQGEMIAEGWVTAGSFFYHSLVWMGRMVVGLVDVLATAVYTRRAYDHLMRLNEAELAELGLDRTEISTYLLAVMEGEEVRSQPAQGDLFALSGRRPANSELPRTEKPARKAA